MVSAYLWRIPPRTSTGQVVYSPFIFLKVGLYVVEEVDLSARQFLVLVLLTLVLALVGVDSSSGRREEREQLRDK